VKTLFKTLINLALVIFFLQTIHLFTTNYAGCVFIFALLIRSTIKKKIHSIHCLMIDNLIN